MSSIRTVVCKKNDMPAYCGNILTKNRRHLSSKLHCIEILEIEGFAEHLTQTERMRAKPKIMNNGSLFNATGCS